MVDVDNLLPELTDNSFLMQTIGTVDILNEMNLSETDYLLTKSIILDIEKQAANSIKKDNIVTLPLIGCVRRNPIQHAIVKHYSLFKEARKTMTTPEYKDYVGTIVKDAKYKDKKLQYTKRTVKTLKINNTEIYNKLVTEIGPAYANMWIKSFLLLDEVPFNADVQEAYDNLNK